MEPSHQANKLIGRLLLVMMLALLVLAFWAQRSSSIVQQVSARADENIHITLRTKPSMLVSYNPATLKARLTVEDSNCNPKKTTCEKIETAKFFAPTETNRIQFWEQFKNGLTQWRFDPFLALQTTWAYLTALHEKRTNLSPAEFILLAFEMMKLEPSDFTVKLPPPAKKRGSRKEPVPAVVPEMPAKASLSVQDRPLILEIFNASGKKGIAQELTQYLRAQNEKGLLRVDVFQYENYPSIQEASWLEDYSGRLADVKQLGHTLGINTEIRAGTATNVMCDTRIIIGKDFNMPL